mgnify:FL=1
MTSYNYDIDPTEVEEYLADVESIYITDHLDHSDFTTLVDELAEKEIAYIKDNNLEFDPQDLIATVATQIREHIDED